MGPLATLLVLASLAGDEASPPWTLESLLDLWALARPRSWREEQVSSFDRTGGNDDGFSGRFTPQREGERVLLDVPGPGCVQRVWSANPPHDTVLAFWLDDEKEPRFECPFADLFSGSRPPFVEPLAAVVSGGGFSYLPIPFAHRLRIVARGPVYFYQITYSRFAEGTPVDSFDPRALAASPLFARTRRALAACEPSPPPAPEVVLAAREAMTAVAPAASLDLAATGPAALTRLTLELESPDPAASRRVLLRISFDDAATPAVEAPLADFFGSGYPGERVQSLPLTSDGRRFESRFVMPFRRSVRVRLENYDPSRPVSVRGTLAGVPGDVSAFGGLAFHAGFERALTRTGKYHEILQVGGRGHFVGCTLTMKSAGGLAYLEGDEQVLVDGETAIAWNGTGTEDFFNAGWYFKNGPFLRFYHGLTHKDEARGEISAYRWFVTDAVPFRRGIDVRIEHGGRNDAPGVEYASTAYWYGDAAEPAGFPPIAEYDLEPPHQVLALPAGTIPVQEMGDAGALQLVPLEQRLRGQTGPRYLSLEQRTGGTRTLSFAVDVADRCRARLVHARGPGLAPIRVAIDGAKAMVVASAAATFEPLAISDLGIAPLSRGDHHLVLELASEQGEALIAGLALGPALPPIAAYEVLGPFPLGDGDGFARDQGPESGEVSGWRRVLADDAGYLDLRAQLDPSERVVAYARFRVRSPDARTVTLRLGSDDFVAVFLDRREVHRHVVHRAAAPDQERVELSLHAGENEILLKIANEEGGFGAFAQIADAKDGLEVLPAR